MCDQHVGSRAPGLRECVLQWETDEPTVTALWDKCWVRSLSMIPSFQLNFEKKNDCGSFTFTKKAKASKARGWTWCLPCNQVNLSGTKTWIRTLCNRAEDKEERLSEWHSWDSLYWNASGQTSFAPFSFSFLNVGAPQNSEPELSPISLFCVLTFNPMVFPSQSPISSRGRPVQLLMKHLCLEVSQRPLFHHVQNGPHHLPSFSHPSSRPPSPLSLFFSVNIMQLSN